MLKKTHLNYLDCGWKKKTLAVKSMWTTRFRFAAKSSVEGFCWGFFVCSDSSIRLGTGASVKKCRNLHNVFRVLKMAAVPLLSRSHREKSVRTHQHMSRTVNRTRAGEWETTARVHTLPAIPSLLLYIYYIVVKSMCVIHAACMITGLYPQTKGVL